MKLTKREFMKVAKEARDARGEMFPLSHDREIMTAWDSEPKGYYLYFNGTWWTEYNSADAVWRRYNAEIRG